MGLRFYEYDLVYTVSNTHLLQLVGKGGNTTILTQKLLENLATEPH